MYSINHLILLLTDDRNTDYSTKTNKLLQDKSVMADITLAFNSEKFKQKELVGDTAYLLTVKVQRAYLNTDETVVDHKDFNKLVFMARQNLKFLIKTVPTGNSSSDSLIWAFCPAGMEIKRLFRA